jgi:hypothetical protein
MLVYTLLTEQSLHDRVFASKWQNSWLELDEYLEIKSSCLLSLEGFFRKVKKIV